MSMILMRTDLANDMRVIRLSDLTGAKVGAIIGGLHAVWSAAQTLSTDGFIRYMTAARIDRLAEVDGFAAAMVDVGWMMVTRDGVEFPDFDAYFGKSSKTRAIDRLRKNRDRKGTGKGGKPDKTRNESGQNSDTTRTESGHVRAPTHDKGSERIGKDRIGKDRNGTHIPPGGGSERVSECAPGECGIGETPESGKDQPARNNAQPPTGNAGAVAVPTPPCPPSPSVGAVGRPEGAERSGGIVDESKGFPGEQLSPYQLERMEAAGKLPHLRAFKAAYPPGRTKKKGPIRELWWRKGCEANPGPVMAGLARWNACDDWRGGYADAAENFLENEQWLDQPPDAKRVNPRDQQAAKAVEGAARVRSAEETWAAFERLGRDGQAAVLERVYERAPGLRGLPAGTDAVRVEVFRELKRERQTA